MYPLRPVISMFTCDSGLPQKEQCFSLEGFLGILSIHYFVNLLIA